MKKKMKSNVSTIGAGIGLVLLALIPTTDYYVIKSVSMNGREIKGDLTGYEYDSVKQGLKDNLDSNSWTINREFALEDVINHNCPNGFSLGEIKGSISKAQLKSLVDGKCN